MQPLNYIPTITNYTKLWWVPNVVVAHQKEGIEAVHLASGRTLCKVVFNLQTICLVSCVYKKQKYVNRCYLLWLWVTAMLYNMVIFANILK